MPCNRNHCVCIGACHRLACSPHCGDPNPEHQMQPRILADPYLTSQQSLLMAITGTFRACLRGYYVVHREDPEWVIAVAPPHHAPAPPKPVPPGREFNMAAPLILVAMYLHRHNLHTADAHHPPPAAPTSSSPQKRWAEMAPEDVAAHLRLACRRLLGLQSGRLLDEEIDGSSREGAIACLVVSWSVGFARVPTI